MVPIVYLTLADKHCLGAHQYWLTMKPQSGWLALADGHEECALACAQDTG